jgi:chemotaxis family two-component system response regulator Rcp1
MTGRFVLQPALTAREVFHILVVDDDRASAELLRGLMKNLRGRYELHFVWDGVEALDFLRRRGAHTEVPRPNLVLLDINMPRLGGLETLSAIKSDPELYMIPVIMLSTSSSLDDVRESYLARANCFVQKPIDLDRSVKLLLSIETFWMDFVLLPPHSAEARIRAMRTMEAAAECGEQSRLLSELGLAVRGLLTLHEQQFQAIVEGDEDCARFDILIHLANEQKQMSKYAYLRHVDAHGCY